MPEYFKTLLLAVVLCVVAAHGNTLPFTKDTVTSLLTHPGRDGAQMLAIQATAAEAARRHTLDNLDKTVDKRTPSSAVEDWSLVCQQLCGAALGGAECYPYCKNMPVLPLKVQIENANTLMDSKKHFICPNLCGLLLGDEACTCKNWMAGDYRSFLRLQGETNVCAIFCDYQHVALAGCSPCPNARESNDNTPDTLTAAIKPMSETVVVAAGEEVTTATTPDWNQLCASLCKTGDGGSLCNCDLSPFFV